MPCYLRRVLLCLLCVPYHSLQIRLHPSNEVPHPSSWVCRVMNYLYCKDIQSKNSTMFTSVLNLYNLTIITYYLSSFYLENFKQPKWQICKTSYLIAIVINFISIISIPNVNFVGPDLIFCFCWNFYLYWNICQKIRFQIITVHWTKNFIILNTNVSRFNWNNNNLFHYYDHKQVLDSSSLNFM